MGRRPARRAAPGRTAAASATTPGRRVKHDPDRSGTRVYVLSRVAVPVPAPLAPARALYEGGRADVAKICATLGVSRATLYRHLKR